MLLTFARDCTRLLLGLLRGDIVVFDTAVLFTSGTGGVSPLHTFPSTTMTAPRLILPNPAETPLVAVLRERDNKPGSQLVEVLNVETMQSVSGWQTGETPEMTPTACAFTLIAQVVIVLYHLYSILVSERKTACNWSTERGDPHARPLDPFGS